MKLYLRYWILSYLLLALLSSCDKDKITTEIDEKIDPSLEVGIVYIKGVIKSTDGVLLPNVTVSVYQFGKKIGSILSDQSGNYNSKTLPIDPKLPITIEYNKQGLNVAYKRFDADSVQQKIFNPLLGKVNDDSITTNENLMLSSPSDTNYVRIWGFTKLANGTPVRGVHCRAIWEYNNFNDRLLWVKSGVSSYTDDQGYFELLVPKNKTIYLNTFYLKYPNSIFGQCNIEFQNIIDNPLQKWRFNELGEIDMDTEISLRNDITLELILLNIKGRALRCDGNPVKTGLIVGTLSEYVGTVPYPLPVNSFIDSNYLFGPNGEFEFYIEACKRLGSIYGMGVRIRENNFEGNTDFSNTENPENFGEVKLCIDHNDYPDEFSLKLGSEPIKNYLKGGDNGYSKKEDIESSFYEQKMDSNETVYLTIENFKLGVQSIKILEMWRTRKKENNIYEIYEKPFIAKPEDVVVTISKIEDPYVYGMITGVVHTNKGDQILDIVFKIYNK